MKRIVLCAVSALLFCFSASAQFCIVAGLNSTQTDIKSAVSDYRNINVYHAGVTYKFGIGSHFALQPSLIYNVKGSSVEYGLQTMEWKTGYLELPVQVQAGISLLKLLRVYGIAEPFVGYALTNTEKSQGGEAKSTWDNIVNRIEYGFGLGAGAEILGHLQVSVRYFWNLGDVYGFSWEDVKSAPSGKCSGISASLAFLF